MELIDLHLTMNFVCQLLQVGHIIVGFFCVLFALILTALLFLMDVVTWFQLKIYEFYIPLVTGAFDVLARGFAYAC